MADLPTIEGLTVPVLVALIALVLFVASLAFTTRKQHHAKPKVDPSAIIQSTKYVEEDGHIVRRSTRVRKPPSDPLFESSTPSRTPTVNGSQTPKARTSARVAARSASKDDTPRRASSPEANGKDDDVASPKGRARRTPRV